MSRVASSWTGPRAVVAAVEWGDLLSAVGGARVPFAIERVWRNDHAGRPHTWRLLADIFATEQVDPVLGHVALRVASESVESESDIGGLLSLIARSPASSGMSDLLNLLSRFVAMDSSARPAVASRDAVWARLSEALLATRERALLEPARVLLLMLFDKPSLATPGVLPSYGRASRALLDAAWSANPELTLLGAQAIRFVGKSFASDGRASRLLLDRILREPRFSQHADQEAGWLGEQILPIVRADPEFAVEIYRCLYSQTISDNTSTMFGGAGSRILPLTSNRRQDYDHALWRLGTALPEFLAIDPASGTRALIEASVGRTAGTATPDSGAGNGSPSALKPLNCVVTNSSTKLGTTMTPRGSIVTTTYFETISSFFDPALSRPSERAWLRPLSATRQRPYGTESSVSAANAAPNWRISCGRCSSGSAS